LIYAVIAARRADREAVARDAILPMLLSAVHEDGSAMTDRELRDELLTLLVAGHETTATGLAWAVERLARHRDKLQRLATKLRAGQDEYLRAVVYETLRLCPVISLVREEETQVRPLRRSCTGSGPDSTTSLQFDGAIVEVCRVARPGHKPSSSAAFCLRTSGRTSSLIGSFSKSASQRSGVISGKSEPNNILR